MIAPKRRWNKLGHEKPARTTRAVKAMAKADLLRNSFS
jgi:hypothetical protein